ncbi:MAG: rhodanese-like domain-containing protein [Gammaproteobacteria bacterium]
MDSITVTQLAKLINDPEAEIILVDVREEWEVEICKIDPSLHIPMSSIPNSLDQLEFNLPIIVYCHHGLRSLHVAHFLNDQGFIHVLNLDGGINAWADEVDPEMAKY